MKKIRTTLTIKIFSSLLELILIISPLFSALNPFITPAAADYNPAWGVLAINSDQSIYRVGDTVHLSFASLDKLGNMDCKTQMHVEVTSPKGHKSVLSTKNGLISVNPDCTKKGFTSRPDFESSLSVYEIGKYSLKLTADNVQGTYTVEDFLQVQRHPKFRAEHVSPTRIFPRETYPVEIQLTTKNNFQGMVELDVPSSFAISNQEGELPFSQDNKRSNVTTLRWYLQNKAGEQQKLKFYFDAPDHSPDFYTFSPLRIIDTNQQLVFEEQRSWQIASDATFSMNTGYYVGTGTDNRAITGIGFQPELVILKDSSINGDDGVLFKMSNMTGETTGKMSDAESDVATDNIQSLDSDGFTVGTDLDVNGANVRFVWLAFAGSDCSSSGTFCVGSYTGNGTSQSITSVGFQPNFVFVKRSGATGGIFATSSMPATNSTPIGTANVVTNAITSLDATGFSVGNNNFTNVNSNTYWYFAFKTASLAFSVGTFTGNGSARSITGLGYLPNAVFIKNANATTTQNTFYNTTDNYGDESYSTGDNNLLKDVITSLDSDGFSVGTNAAANENTKTIYWFAFGGAPAVGGASGSYTLATGSYTGNGTSQSVTGLSFQPDLVIIKDNAANYAVFTTYMNAVDTTFYFSNAAVTFTGGITSINTDGFSVGSSTVVNTNTNTYHWQAFGNAWSPSTKTGAANFLVGAYNGNGQDDRNITGFPFQPDLVAIKSASTNASGAFRSSAQSGDLSSPFGALAESADYIQALNSSGFQIGTNSRVNNSSASNIYTFFAFKTGPNFKVGTYSGTGATQSITSPNIQPDLIWIKGTAATGSMLRPSTLAGNNTQYFDATANVSGEVTSIDTTGFSLGTGTNTNSSGTNNYRYAVWKVPTTYTQNDFKWMVSANSVTLTDTWPPGTGVSLAENTAINLTPATNRPLSIGDKVRIQMNLTIGGSRMGSTQQAFKLQYSAASNCTTAVSWTDVGAKASVSIWRLFDEASIGDSTAQVNDISTSNSGSEGYYSEINASATNPNAVASGNNTEWDWPVENNGAADTTSYCFRMILDDGTVLDTYNSDSYPQLYTAPATASFMRHGNYFNSETEKGFFWLN